MKIKFEMTDFRLLNSYLGIQVIEGKNEIKICQINCALKFLDRKRKFLQENNKT